MDRLKRLAQKARAKERASRMLTLWRKMTILTMQTDAREVGIYTHSPKRCSCSMCGNPRRMYGPKHSEIKRMPPDD